MTMQVNELCVAFDRDSSVKMQISSTALCAFVMAGLRLQLRSKDVYVIKLIRVGFEGIFARKSSKPRPYLSLCDKSWETRKVQAVRIYSRALSARNDHL